MTNQKLRQLFAITSMGLAAILMTGCVSVNKQALSTSNVDTLKDQRVARLARDKKPDFAAMTAGRATFAIIGALVMISEGNALVASNAIDDPANDIAAGMIDTLSRRYGAQGSATDTPIKADDTTTPAGTPAARYIVDVQTINWGFAYFPTDWTHYRVLYSVKARLYDAQTKTVLAEGFCRRAPEKTDTSPTYDEMLANQAAVIKKALLQWRDECTAELLKDMFPSAVTATTNASAPTAAVAVKSGS